MSSNSFAATLDLALRPSVRALKVLFLLHIVPLALLPFAMRGGPPMIAVGAAIFASWLSLRRHAVLGFGRRALVRLVWHADGRWTIHDAAGGSDAALLGHSYVHPGLMVLRFRREDGAVRTRALLGDETEPELLRRLRARLSVEGASAPPASR